MHDFDVAALLRVVPLDDVMRDLHVITGFDRYQASDGVCSAAEAVADRARLMGLSDVALRHYDADGSPQWWTFEAPTSWTPGRARMDVLSAGTPGLTVDHAERPYSLATHSAQTAPGGEVLPLRRWTLGTSDDLIAGSVVVVDADDFRSGAAVASLVARGARGFVTDALWKGDHDDAHQGRIELPPGCGLFAFSLTPDVHRRVADAAGAGARARVTVEVDRTAPMPVVTGVIPGTGPEEIWVTSHLCHPGPGANDNASGVASSLGLAATLLSPRVRALRGPRRYTVRFVWAPEFVGTAAMLHWCLREDGPPRPRYVLNLDMVGEDQELCRSPFVVERPPDLRATLLTPLTEHAVGEVFGATADSPGRWHPVPFQGFSDHALFADPSVDSPAVQFCHPDDRFNHSAGDSFDKVSRVEMLRATTAGAALLLLLEQELTHPSSARRITESWCEREESRARALASRHEPRWGEGLVRHVRRHNDALLAALEGEPGSTGNPERPGIHGGALTRGWDGPLNLRSMIGRLSPGTAKEIRGQVARDKSTLAVLFNLAIRADGTRSRQDIVEDASYALRRPLESSGARALLEALEESGWCQEV